MRQGLCCGVVLCGLAMQGAMAQESRSSQTSLGSNQSILVAMQEPVTDEGYKAEKVSRSVQTLSDGTVITHETRGLIARDAQGRVREEMNIVQSGQVDGKQQNMSLQSVMVGDPVAHTILIWTGGSYKVATLMHLPVLSPLPKLPSGVRLGSPSPSGGMVGNQPKQIVAIREEAAPPVGSSDITDSQLKIHMPDSTKNGSKTAKDEVYTEDLGQQAIEGLLVTGKRTTTTIATGKIGNDRPIVVVHEEWRSPELKIMVKTIDTDPRTGVQTMELQGLTRVDPDPALFQAPTGYTVRDMADTMKSLGDAGNAKAQ